MNNKLTAVEWLMEKISYDNGYGLIRNSFDEMEDLSELFEQAKAMEKEQAKIINKMKIYTVIPYSHEWVVQMEVFLNDVKSFTTLEKAEEYACKLSTNNYDIVKSDLDMVLNG